MPVTTCTLWGTSRIHHRCPRVTSAAFLNSSSQDTCCNNRAILAVFLNSISRFLQSSSKPTDWQCLPNPWFDKTLNFYLTHVNIIQYKTNKTITFSNLPTLYSDRNSLSLEEPSSSSSPHSSQPTNLPSIFPGTTDPSDSTTPLHKVLNEQSIQKPRPLCLHAPSSVCSFWSSFPNIPHHTISLNIYSKTVSHIKQFKNQHSSFSIVPYSGLKLSWQKSSRLKEVRCSWNCLLTNLSQKREIRDWALIGDWKYCQQFVFPTGGNKDLHLIWTQTFPKQDIPHLPTAQ